MSSRALTAILFAFLLIGSVHAHETLTPYVNDFAGLLNANERQDLNAYATEIDNKTGVEIAIVTLKTTNGEEPLSYAEHLGNQNKVGKHGQDSGIVILWVTGSQRGAIATGAGIRGKVSDAEAIALGKANKPLLVQGDVYHGMGNMMKGLNEEITRQDPAPVAAPPQLPSEGAGQIHLHITSVPPEQQTEPMPFLSPVALWISTISVVTVLFLVALATYASSRRRRPGQTVTECEAINRSVKVPKQLPKRFVKKYKLHKRGDKYYKRTKDKNGNVRYVQQTDNSMLYLWMFYLTFRDNGGYHGTTANPPLSDTSSPSSSSYSSSASYSSAASSSGSFGGGGGFGGGGSGGGGGGF